MKKKLSIILFILLEIFSVYVEKKYISLAYPIDRMIIFTCINLFICMHFYFDVKKLYDFIFKKRYYICFGLLLYITIMGYSGSSMTFWNGIVQSHHPVQSGTVILGEPRGIRGDEFFVSTPTTFSQEYNDFQYMSDRLMGRNDSVVLYPSLPSKHISILGRFWDIGFLFLPLENAYAFSWFAQVFLIFMASFELGLIVAKENRLYALLTAFLVTFSSASCWWSNMTILGVGALAIVLFSIFLKTDKKSIRILCSILIGIVGASYILLMYPAWQVPFGYVYLCFVIYLLYEYRKKLYFKMLLYLPIVLIVIGIIVIPTFLDSMNVFLLETSTVYPGARMSIGGFNKERLFCYYLNMFFPFKEFFNPSEYGNFISLYPLPIIVSIVLGINKIRSKLKFDLLLFLMTLFAILLSIWNYVQIPVLVSKLSLLSFSTDGRCQLAVAYLCVLIIIRILALYEKNIKISIKKIIVCCVVSVIFNVLCILFVNHYFDEYFTKKMMIVDLVLFVPVVVLFLLNYKKTNQYLVIALIGMTLLSGVVVNPITKGIGVFYDKPVSREIAKIRKKDNDARWLVVHSNYAIPNYVLANGVVVINSTNFSPNLDLWEKFDEGLSNEYIYNRYAHVRVDFTNDKTYYELLFEDSFMLHLNVNDLDVMDVQYILSMEEIGELLQDRAKCIYDDGVYIYQVV